VPDIVIHAVTAAAYAVLAWHFWNTRWRSRPGEATRTESGLRPAERAAILLPLGLHGALLYLALFAPDELRFGFALALSSMLWLAVLFYWLESLFYNLDGMQPPALALAALAVPLPAIFPGRESGPLAASLEFRLHLVMAILAYSLFTIAMLHAVLMAIVERRLHHSRRGRGAGGAIAEDGAAMLGGLTLTLATGIAFSETLFGRPLRFDHKTLFALLSWATFALLLAGRHLYGWRGRTALRWTLSGFVLLLLAYVGSRFVLEVLLGRG
jgi:ABC-type uncharacterized transport system permease subunit